MLFRSGVFTLKAYVSNSDNTLNTKAISFNIICVEDGYQGKFIAVNDVSEEIINYSENKVFDYCLYDSGLLTTAINFGVEKDNEIIYETSEANATTASKNTFQFSLEYPTIDDNDFDVTVKAYTYSTDVRVNNKLGYNAVGGSVFFMNPKTRTNAQSNKETIINESNKSNVSAAINEYVNWRYECPHYYFQNIDEPPFD